MVKKEYTISELENLTSVSRRTIHYYIKEGMIPSPIGAGGAAKYEEVHYLRLILISQIKKSHIKLAGIKEALDSMSLDEMRNLATRFSEDEPTWDADALNNWILNDIHINRIASPPEPDSFVKLQSDSPLNSSASAKKLDNRNVSYLKDLKRASSRETKWNRFEIVDGFEINIRNDIQKQQYAYLNRLIEEIRNYLIPGEHR